MKTLFGLVLLFALVFGGVMLFAPERTRTQVLAIFGLTGSVGEQIADVVSGVFLKTKDFAISLSGEDVEDEDEGEEVSGLNTNSKDASKKLETNLEVLATKAGQLSANEVQKLAAESSQLLKEINGSSPGLIARICAFFGASCAN